MTSYIVLMGTVVFLWGLILWKFLRNWKIRRNPISLSICAAILLLMWSAVAGIWVLKKEVDLNLAVFLSTGTSFLFAAYANFTFYWAEKKFDESRKE